MEKKQTAVEWLIEKINKDLIHKSMGQIYGKAKAMEKEQNQLELPTDEEIDDVALETFINDSKRFGFIEGVKWMRDKINGGKDEN